MDDTNLESATVQITANYVNGQDVLAMPVTPGITGMFNPATGHAHAHRVGHGRGLSGRAADGDLLQRIEQPVAAARRTVTWIVNDGDVNSAGATSTINVIAVNDAPMVANETFQLLGNTELRVDMAAGHDAAHVGDHAGPAVEGVLDNDGDPEGDPFAVTGHQRAVADATAPFDCTLDRRRGRSRRGQRRVQLHAGAGRHGGSFTYTVTDTPVARACRRA